jgi:hypothetical protein
MSMLDPQPCVVELSRASRVGPEKSPEKIGNNSGLDFPHLARDGEFDGFVSPNARLAHRRPDRCPPSPESTGISWRTANPTKLNGLVTQSPAPAVNPEILSSTESRAARNKVSV